MQMNALDYVRHFQSVDRNFRQLDDKTTVSQWH